MPPIRFFISTMQVEGLPPGSFQVFRTGLLGSSDSFPQHCNADISTSWVFGRDLGSMGVAS